MYPLLIKNKNIDFQICLFYITNYMMQIVIYYIFLILLVYKTKIILISSIYLCMTSYDLNKKPEV